jgi:predicted PurR-regulated permease PerM
MWIVFFVISLIAIVILLFYILIELNEFEKKINEIAADIKKHYENG